MRFMVMLMDINAGTASKTAPSGSVMRRSIFVVGLVSVGFLAAWTALSISLIQGAEVWLTTTHYTAHLLSNVFCMGVAAVYAGRLHGSLDEKFVQALTAVVVVFGLFAMAILGGRLFFSRALLMASVVGAAIAAIMVVAIRHKLDQWRVAVIGPLVEDLPNPASFGQLICDPTADLRNFDIVLVSLTGQVSPEWSKALSRAMLAGCKIRHVGEHIEELNGAVSVEHFELDHLPTDGISSYRLLKRAIDITLVVAILPIALPLMILAAVLILATMGRPILFRQERIGLGGEPFTILKLRTMRPERPGEAVAAAIVGDMRVTKLGRILRRLHIDELPQLWNVLRGDMSLIGPRPEARPLHDHYISVLPNYAYRYLVRPGITGWAQVSAPPSVNAEEALHKLTFDLFYVKKLSPYLDVLIGLRTIWTLVAGGGAR